MTNTDLVRATDPRTGEPVGAGTPRSTDTEVDRLLAAAESAAPSLRDSTPVDRTRLLRALADRLDAERHRLVPVAAAESGLPLPRLTGEVARTSGQLRLFAEVLDDGGLLEAVLDSADDGLAPPRPDLRRWLEPVGPVLVFAASNFPFAFSVLGGDTASALASGCPVLVKVHDGHPRLSGLVAELADDVVRDLGLPAGTFGAVFGEAAGLRALRDRRVRAAGFTGSTRGGRFLFDVAASRPDPIPFFGELGSINPAVVTPAAVGARGAEVAAGFVASMTLGTGQFCTKPGLLLLPVGHGLEDTLTAAVQDVAAAPMLNERIRDQLGGGLDELAARDDVRLLAEGCPAPTTGAWGAASLFGTTAEALLADPERITEEHFGPTALVVEYDGTNELVAALRAVGGTLTATVHAEDSDADLVRSLMPTLRDIAGRVILNGWPTGVAVAWAMQHGGPWPATTAAGHTSVGATSTRRWQRPVCYQSVPNALLPEGLRDANPWGLPRRIDGVLR
jgi:NADP-dependent aldehyde dehydrogenase